MISVLMKDKMYESKWTNRAAVNCLILAVVLLVVVLVVLVKLGVHMHTILRGFILYAQLSPIAVAYFPDSYNMRQELVSLNIF